MTLKEVYNQSLKKLQNPDVEEINIRIILCYINKINSMSELYLKFDENIRNLPQFNEILERYLSGEPLQYILKRTEFYGLYFYVDNRVLIPRQETEEVVDFAVNYAKNIFGNSELNVADVCCGSGCMGLSFSKHANTKNLYLSDISQDAIEVAKINSKNFKIDSNFFVGNAVDELIKNNKKIDVLLCNPPYILNRNEVDKNVLNYEPQIALFIDENLSIFRDIISKLNLLKNNKLIVVFEIGYDLKDKLEKIILEMIPNCKYNFKKDINGKYRIFSLLIE